MRRCDKNLDWPFLGKKYPTEQVSRKKKKKHDDQKSPNSQKVKWSIPKQRAGKLFHCVWFPEMTLHVCSHRREDFEEECQHPLCLRKVPPHLRHIHFPTDILPAVTLWLNTLKPVLNSALKASSRWQVLHHRDRRTRACCGQRILRAGFSERVPLCFLNYLRFSTLLWF